MVRFQLNSERAAIKTDKRARKRDGEGISYSPRVPQVEVGVVGRAI